MKNTLIMITLVALTASSSNALECKKQKDDLKSVREMIQASPKTPQKEIDLVDSFRAMFNEGKTTGQLRTMYISHDQKDANSAYTTAAGGYLKFETAKLDGLNAGFSLTYSEDIGGISGDIDKGERNDELSSGDGRCAQLSEAYFAFEGCFLDYKLGRQVIDTPLADSDDIRMVQNSFEAITAEYPSDAVNVTLGYLNRWQGSDAGLDDEWIDTGDNGTSFVGLSYSDIVDLQAWYYNINGGESANNAMYMELAYTHEISEEIGLGASLQYLKESELDNSGVEANIYGALLELNLNSVTLAFAYNGSKKEEAKTSFSGFGGGTLFTNMDSMIIDEITEDRDASSYVTGVAYQLSDFRFLYAYGDFTGEEDSNGIKAHIVEQNIGIEYNYKDEFVAYLIYVKDEDKQSEVSTDYDFEHIRLMANYNF